MADTETTGTADPEQTEDILERYQNLVATLRRMSEDLEAERRKTGRLERKLGKLERRAARRTRERDRVTRMHAEALVQIDRVRQAEDAVVGRLQDALDRVSGELDEGRVDRARLWAIATSAVAISCRDFGGINAYLKNLEDATISGAGGNVDPKVLEVISGVCAEGFARAIADRQRERSEQRQTGPNMGLFVFSGKSGDTPNNRREWDRLVAFLGGEGLMPAGATAHD